MFQKFLVLCVFYLALFQHKTKAAITAEQRSMIKEHFQLLEATCFKEFPISDDDATTLRAKKLASGPNVPCFLGCIFKQIGMINDDGNLEKETVMSRAKQVFNTDEELQLLSDYLHSCIGINDNPVTDGNKGCERSAMAFECLIKNAASYEFEF
ncbi:uncharacterized protein LOC121734759 [Aricia agestis]|uniref:uncharacterized protein LOC121734759 n=1 Tax=Aricia agestis TaxID=91739 RepID=UPI001C203933|nr:uncharacterized protein LOC121734759 [Aricia agestis]